MNIRIGQQAHLNKLATRLETDYAKVRGYRTLARKFMDNYLLETAADLRAGEPQQALSMLALLLHEAARAMAPGNPEPRIYTRAIGKISEILWVNKPQEQETRKGNRQ